MDDIPKRKTRLIRSEIIVALAAITISIATLFVYIYQATIMQAQQHISVWPYIQWTFTISSEEGFFISVENKGVGPAIIKSESMRLDGQFINDPQELINKIIGNTDSLSLSLSLFTETVKSRVLSPGDIIYPFHIRGRNYEDYLILQKKFDGIYSRLQYEICYCSIYGDCWTSTGLEVEESICK